MVRSHQVWTVDLLQHQSLFFQSFVHSSLKWPHQTHNSMCFLYPWPRTQHYHITVWTHQPDTLHVLCHLPWHLADTTPSYVTTFHVSKFWHVKIASWVNQDEFEDAEFGLELDFLPWACNEIGNNNSRRRIKPFQ